MRQSFNDRDGFGAGLAGYIQYVRLEEVAQRRQDEFCSVLIVE